MLSPKADSSTKGCYLPVQKSYMIQSRSHSSMTTPAAQAQHKQAADLSSEMATTTGHKPEDCYANPKIMTQLSQTSRLAGGVAQNLNPVFQSIDRNLNQSIHH